MRKTYVLAGLLSALSACGGQALTTPETLRITTYPSDTEFTITFVMESCKDACATYEPSECEAEYEGNTIKLDIEVPYERSGEVCAEACAGEVLAHCAIKPLVPGDYTVESGGFRAEITVR